MIHTGLRVLHHNILRHDMAGDFVSVPPSVCHFRHIPPWRTERSGNRAGPLWYGMFSNNHIISHD